MVSVIFHRSPKASRALEEEEEYEGAFTFWLQTNGVDANGAAAKVIYFDRSGKKVRPGTFGKIKVG